MKITNLVGALTTAIKGKNMLAIMPEERGVANGFLSGLIAIVRLRFQLLP